MLFAPGENADRVRAYLGMLRLPYDAAIFDDVEACVAWTSVGDKGRELLRQSSDRVTELSRAGSMAYRVRSAMREALRRGDTAFSLESLADKLGTSPRSLQRALAAMGCSYREELRKLQVERAMQLLETSDVKLAGIALEVGFRKLQNLNCAFEEVVGTSPRDYRARHRST